MNDTTDDRPAAPRRARHLMDPNAPQRDTINSVGTTRVQTWVMSTLVVTTILHLAGGLLIAAWYIDPATRASWGRRFRRRGVLRGRSRARP